MQNGMILESGLEEIGMKSVTETGLQIDSFLEPIDSLLREGRYDVAYRFLKILRPWQGEKEWIAERLGTVSRKMIPRWHFEMLNDGERNQAFADALQAVDLRDKIVLDIGAGSGLLSMLAVRHGAKHVYACEMVEPLAETAMEIVRRNGMAHKITIIPKISSEMEIGKDMPVRADVMVSETMDSGFVGEGFLPSLGHARKHLLQPNARLVPCAGRLCGVLVESPDIHGMNHVDRSLGFDVSSMNEFCSRGYFRVRLKTRAHRQLSEVTTLLAMDLYEPVPERITRVIEFKAVQNGTVHGIGFWFNVALAPGIELSNDPDRAGSHWPQSFITFHEPIPVRKGACHAMKLTFRRHALGQHGISMAPLEPRKQFAAGCADG